MARVVRFDRACAPYNAGERAGFTEGKAADLVARGLAVYVTTDAEPMVTKGAPAPAARPVEIPQPRDEPEPKAPEPEAEPEPVDEKPPTLIERVTKKARTRKKAKAKARAKPASE